MHDHLIDLGREIAENQSPYRLWSPQQIMNVDNEVQGIAIRGITTIAARSTSEIEEFPQCSPGGKLIVNTNRGPYRLEPSSLRLKFFHVTGNCYKQVIGELSRELVWLRWNGIEQRNLQSLSSLKNLRILELYGNGYHGGHCLKELWTENNAPMQLRELTIQGCSEFQRFPKSIGCLRHLKKIVVSYGSKLKNLPEEFCLLQSLEQLELNGPELSSLPKSFGDLRNLRHLDLHNCSKLKRLPISFKELTLLQHISLDGCFNLALESNILENMTKLECLKIQGCDQLEELPRHITNQASLTELSCSIKSLREVPVNIGQLSKLQTISIGALEELRAHTRWEEAGIESLEYVERLRRVELQAFGRSGVEGCIQNIQKWPKEITVCTRAVPDASALSPKNSLRLACTTENTERKIYISSYDWMELEKGKWVWAALFTQYSLFHNIISRDAGSRVPLVKAGKVEEGEVERGLLVMGEEERVKEAFTRLLASLSN
ncbi:disease resistance-like protein DSC1 [Cryptomeria japonica]|uniref:disease resistance-like protein DSC1 n=1 Tax=Cryptomeria japonica TaxID=3369 RepID=UPI0027DA3D27|nr:disease resistance-like protein DSC1 [Cryptomeria japonica]